MKRTFVTYDGDPRRPTETEHRIDGMDPWQVGEKREFTDALAAEFDGTSGADFALAFCHAENANLTAPIFTLTETGDDETSDDETSDDAPTPTTDTSTTPPAAPSQPAAGV